MVAPRVGDVAPPLRAQPVFGCPVVLPHPQGRPVALVFLADLAGPVGRASVERLQAAVRDVELAGASLVVVSRTSLVTARDLVPRYHLLFPVVCDPGGQLFQAWGLGIGGYGSAIRGLVGLGRPGLRTLLAHWPTGLGSSFLFLGGTFLVDGDGRILQAHRARTPLDLPEVHALAAALA